MAAVVGAGKVKLDNGQIVNAQEGGWYDARRYMGGNLLNPGEDQPGHLVSNEVIAQTNPKNVAYVQQQRQQVAPSNPAPQQANQGYDGASFAGGDTGGGVGVQTQPAINLPDIYKNLYASSGIKDLEDTYSKNTQDYNTAISQINDNPFLSEATRQGRLAKLSTDFENRTANVKNDIATRKADIETQLNLQTKQFDINSQQAQQAFQQFQSLLQSGALNNASGEDIANITRATGVSSGMIKSAVNAQKQKNIQTSVMQYDDGTNQGFAVINSNTGEVINKQDVAASKPTKATGGGSGALSDTRQLALEKAQAPKVLLQGAKLGKTLPDMMQYGLSQGLSAADVYNIYGSVNYYHATPAQVKADKKKFGVK